jgi:hypothetical protein
MALRSEHRIWLPLVRPARQRGGDKPHQQPIARPTRRARQSDDRQLGPGKRLVVGRLPKKSGIDRWTADPQDDPPGEWERDGKSGPPHAAPAN